MTRALLAALFLWVGAWHGPAPVRWGDPVVPLIKQGVWRT